jgi:hypothetical protein
MAFLLAGPQHNAPMVDALAAVQFLYFFGINKKGKGATIHCLAHNEVQTQAHQQHTSGKHAQPEHNEVT